MQEERSPNSSTAGSRIRLGLARERRPGLGCFATARVAGRWWAARARTAAGCTPVATPSTPNGRRSATFAITIQFTEEILPALRRAEVRAVCATLAPAIRIGATGFEPATPSTPSRRATGVDVSPEASPRPHRPQTKTIWVSGQFGRYQSGPPFSESSRASFLFAPPANHERYASRPLRSTLARLRRADVETRWADVGCKLINHPELPDATGATGPPTQMSGVLRDLDGRQAWPAGKAPLAQSEREKNRR